MLISSWNVNSIRIRQERLLEYLLQRKPDFLCLQELKCTEDVFPHEILADSGYQAAIYGQKTYNGVAILYRSNVGKVWRGFDHNISEPDARLIWMEVEARTLLGCLYVPNGGSLDSEKYPYKLNWFDRLLKLVRQLDKQYENIILCGDFNIAREDIDVHDPKAWEGQVLFSAPERDRLEALLALGFVDPFRRLHETEKAFSWWDYRQLAFQKNLGLRIDYTFAKFGAAHWKITSSGIDRDFRKGVKPSDHAPVWFEFTKE